MHKRLWVLIGILTTAFTFIWSAAASLSHSTNQTPDQYTRLTFASSEPTRESTHPEMNSDGTKIVFDSNSDLLGEGITADKVLIWLYDTTTMTYTRITTAPEFLHASQSPAITSDGTKIVFQSNVGFLDTGLDRYPSDQIWLYDTTTMTFTRITTATDTNRYSVNPAISDDGTKIVFLSDSDLLGEGIGHRDYQIWLYDTTVMTFTRVTTSAVSASYHLNLNPAISSDGTKIVFHSDADLHGEGIRSNEYQIWLYNILSKTLTRLTTSTDTNRSNRMPDINGDGTKIVFHSDSDLLGEGIVDNEFHVWLYDTANLTFTRITTGNVQRDGSHPTINSDGTKIAFGSNFDLLGEGLEDDQRLIWLYDTTTMTFTRSITYQPSNLYRTSFSPAINNNGTKIAFMSDVDLFNEGGTNNYEYQIWLWDVLNLLDLPTNYSVNGQTLTVSWGSVGLNNCHYHLYHSHSPYIGFDVITTNLAGLNVNIPLNTVSNPSINSFYYIRTMGCDGGQEAISPTFSEFGFALSSGG